jgi:hypothetical protein
MTVRISDRHEPARGGARNDVVLQAELGSLVLANVAFHGDTLEAIGKDGEIYISVRRLCQLLGLGRLGQQQKLKRKKMGLRIHFSSGCPGPRDSLPLALWPV